MTKRRDLLEPPDRSADALATLAQEVEAMVGLTRDSLDITGHQAPGKQWKGESHA